MNLRTGKGICSKSRRVYIGDTREAFVTTLLVFGVGTGSNVGCTSAFPEIPSGGPTFTRFSRQFVTPASILAARQYHNIKKKVRRDLKHINYIHLTIHNLASQLLLFLLAFPNRHLFRPRRIRPVL